MSKYFKSMMQISVTSALMGTAIFADQSGSMNGNMGNAGGAQGCVMNPLCPIYPKLNDSYSVHMDIGYLLEQFILTGTDFAYTTGSYSTLPASVGILRPKFNVASGLTADLGYYFEHDNWFMDFRFDWVSRKGKKDYDTATGQVVPLGVWATGILGGSDATYFTSVTESLDVSYYMLEWDFSKGSYFTNRFAVEPHAGLKAAWIYYDGDISYTGGSASTNTLTHDQNTSFWGLGPVLGVDTMWKYTDHFSSFCKTSLGLLAGGIDVDDTVQYNTSSIYYTSAGENPIVMSPTARAIIGFEYNTAAFNDSQNFSFRIALDTSYYWNQFQHVSVSNEALTSTGRVSKFFFADQGGFGMIGMIIDIGWDF